MSQWQVRVMQAADVGAMVALQAECYPPELHEDEPTMQARLVVAPDTSWVAEDAAGVGAYLVCYPSKVGKVNPLGAAFTIPEQADTLYLHDLAVGTRARGQGVGRAVATRAVDYARKQGFTYCTLVAVQGSAPFWRSLGFRPVTALTGEQRAALATYRTDTTYMLNTLAL